MAVGAVEPEDALRQDWLFQANGQSQGDRAITEIGRARSHAARLNLHAKKPDLSTELAELTRLEERQQMSLRRLSEQEILLNRSDLERDAKFKEIRDELLKKLDIIGADLVILKVQFAVDSRRREERK